MPGRIASVRILPFVRKDLPALQRLADQALGAGYVEGARFTADTVIVARTRGRLVGFVHFEPAEGGWSLRTLVVEPALRKRGLGSALARMALARYPDARWISPAWIDRNRIAADPMLRALGFAPQRRVPDYWLADSLERGYACPCCGNPCRCAAMVYALQKQEGKP